MDVRLILIFYWLYTMSLPCHGTYPCRSEFIKLKHWPMRGGGQRPIPFQQCPFCDRRRADTCTAYKSDKDTLKPLLSVTIWLQMVLVSNYQLTFSCRVGCAASRWVVDCHWAEEVVLVVQLPSTFPCHLYAEFTSECVKQRRATTSTTCNLYCN